MKTKQTIHRYWTWLLPWGGLLGGLLLASMACSLGAVGVEPTSTPNSQPFLTTTQSPTLPPDSGECADPGQPGEADIQEALNYTGQAFSGLEWERSYTVLADRVTVTWENDDEGALAYLEHLVYDCGYVEADIDAFFSEQSLKEVILQDYERPELLESCKDASGDLRLYELSAWIHEQTYLVRIWVTLPQPNRMVYVFLTYPEVGQEQLQAYARDLFPALQACEAGN
jgi:hypothetical protein